MLSVEHMILGACLLEAKAVPIAMSLVDSDHFYGVDKDIFDTMKHLFDKGLGIDLVSVFSKGKHDPNYLAGITSHICTGAHIRTHCLYLKEMYIKQKIIESGQDMVGNNQDSIEALDSITTKLTELQQHLITNQPKEIRLVSMDSGEVGMSTGYPVLDKKINGLERKAKIEIAGATSMGKSAFALNIINYVCVDCNNPVVLFSLEMSAASVKRRLLSIRTQIDNSRIKRGDIYDSEREKYDYELDKINNAPFFIDDYGSLTPNELKAKTVQLTSEHDIKLVVIDLMGLMNVANSDKKNRTMVVSEISRANKQLAMQLDIPLIEIAQVNRSVHSASDSRPVLKHLKDSGQIEQDADVVLFPFRPTMGEPDDNGHTEIIVAKCRDGEVNVVVDMKFTPNTLTFTESTNDNNPFN